VTQLLLEEDEYLDLRGDQMPRYWTVPPRHAEIVDECRACGGTRYPGVGCGDNLSTEALDVARGWGYDLDPWQRWSITNALGTRPDGKWAAKENAIIVSRQNGKGTILEVRELIGLYVLREPLIIHTAHLLVTAQEHFLRLVEVIENNPWMMRQLKGGKPRLANGQESITLKAKPTLIFGAGGKRVRRNGQVRLKFLARASKGSARGLSCDCLVFDEAMMLPTELVGAALPTLSARGNPQVWYCGSAGMEDSFQLAKIHTRIVKDNKTLFGAEWCASLHKETCPRDEARGRRLNDYVVNCTAHDDRDDPRTWAKGNPALGRRLAVDWIKTAELDSMDFTEFNRERCGEGQWPTEEAQWKVVPEDLWESLAVPLGNRTKPFAFAVDVAEDSSSASIGAAWTMMTSNGRKLVIEIPRGCQRPGTGWVLERLRQLDEKWKPLAIVVPRSGPAAGLGDDIQKQWPDSPKWGTKVIRATVTDEAAAYAWFVQQCKDRSKPLVHPVQEKAAGLYSAVGTAEPRLVGDGGKTWSRRDSASDITPATSANLAAWGLNKMLRDVNPLAGIG
jgi:hypothetical protein